MVPLVFTCCGLLRCLHQTIWLSGLTAYRRCMHENAEITIHRSSLRQPVNSCAYVGCMRYCLYLSVNLEHMVLHECSVEYDKQFTSNAFVPCLGFWVLTHGDLDIWPWNVTLAMHNLHVYRLSLYSWTVSPDDLNKSTSWLWSLIWNQVPEFHRTLATFKSSVPSRFRFRFSKV